MVIVEKPIGNKWNFYVIGKPLMEKNTIMTFFYKIMSKAWTWKEVKIITIENGCYRIKF